MGKDITLIHPILGERTYNEVVARKIMAMVNNGGWEFKKPSRGSGKTPAFSKDKDASNAQSDTTITKDTGEEGGN